MTIYRAYLETTHFVFEAFAESEAAAWLQMRQTWTRHRRQYKAPDTWAVVEDSVSVAAISVPSGLRDREQIL